MFSLALFYAMAALLVFSAIMVVSRKNPISSAIYLVIALCLVAGLYATLGADFAAAIQILVYTGAIMVLFLFVIMLLNLDPEHLRGPEMNGGEIVVLLLTILGFAGIVVAMAYAPPPLPSGPFTMEAIDEVGGNTRVVGMKLLVNYLWAFEMASFLILLAIVASILIAKKPKPDSMPASSERGQ